MGSEAVRMVSTPARYQQGWEVPTGRYERKNSWSKLEASKQASEAGWKARAGAKGNRGSGSSVRSAFIEAKDGNRLVSKIIE